MKDKSHLFFIISFSLKNNFNLLQSILFNVKK